MKQDAMPVRSCGYAAQLQRAVLFVEADVSDGGSGRILSQWPAREVGRGDEILGALEQYVRAQVPVIIAAAVS